jgi:hypothetical protein
LLSMKKLSSLMKMKSLTTTIKLLVTMR